ncbi:preprotein translocase subunit SecA [bacterium]|nr:preprotein translocase subunit SecA [candidate division CSSED10-310 bacterium]
MSFFDLIWKIFPSANDRAIRRIDPLVHQINDLESTVQALDHDAIRSRIADIRIQIEQGMSLESALPDVFALVREASRRVLNMRHFDVQLIGGIVLHEGKIAEMKTGEGKTLVGTLPVVLNALTGKGVHVVTVNDYLAARDADWMGQIYRYLGLTVGVIRADYDHVAHYKAYRCDITYGTNSEFGFDYLRDNMKIDIREFAQRSHYYAIVDEVDSILIDEARTPLIISGPSEDATDLYRRVDGVIPALRKDIDYTVDEKSRTASLTDDGVAHCERIMNIDNLYDPRNMTELHHLNQALRAHTLFKRDVEYVVKDGQIAIVDEFTGRLMPGRRWSDGLHQAVEAKEKVPIQSENQTVATITYQNYFRMYDKLAGMTGTALTEAAEFANTYKLDVICIPTNQPLIRDEYPDIVMKTEREKFNRVVEDIEKLHAKGRPILVGTIAIEKSEKLSRLLKQKKIPHNVLNAKHHAREAEIIAQAGRKGAVTIATNMAGRGTDILLGGNPEFLARTDLMSLGVMEESPEYPNRYAEMLQKKREQTDREHAEVVEAGGLHVLGTERHESRRIDNQLRGRAGRQGDPGSSCFYLSLEDDLMRIFAPERIAAIMERLGMEEGQEITHPMITRAIESAQKKVEQHHFAMRKNLLEYDDVMNRQREILYTQRNEVLAKGDVREMIEQMISDVVESILEQHIEPKTHQEQWNFDGIQTALRNQFNAVPSLEHPAGDYWEEESFLEYLIEEYRALYARRREETDAELMHWFQRIVLLDHIDSNWKHHLLNMDHLREGIGLRGYGQRDPLTEYKREGFTLFDEMVHNIKVESVRALFFHRPVIAEPSRRQPMRNVRESHGPMPVAQSPRNRPLDETAAEDHPVVTVRRTHPKVGRNDPCPCGSGKKYKKCCGA